MSDSNTDWSRERRVTSVNTMRLFSPADLADCDIKVVFTTTCGLTVIRTMTPGDRLPHPEVFADKFKSLWEERQEQLRRQGGKDVFDLL